MSVFIGYVTGCDRSWLRPVLTGHITATTTTNHHLSPPPPPHTTHTTTRHTHHHTPPHHDDDDSDESTPKKWKGKENAGIQGMLAIFFNLSFSTRRGGTALLVVSFLSFQRDEEGPPSSPCHSFIFDATRRVRPPHRVILSFSTRRGGSALLVVSFVHFQHDKAGGPPRRVISLF